MLKLTTDFCYTFRQKTVPAVSNLALKVVEIILVRNKNYIRNQKAPKFFVTKHLHCSSFKQKYEKACCHFFNFITSLFGSSFTMITNLLSLLKDLTNNKVGEKSTINIKSYSSNVRAGMSWLEFKNSHVELLYEKDILTNFAKFIGAHL